MSVTPIHEGITPEILTKVDDVAATLEGYAERGVFRGFSRGPVAGGKASFKILWHRDRQFDMTFDAATDSFRFASVLEQIPAGEPMYAELKDFIRSFQSSQLPEHRRIDREKALVQAQNRGGKVSLVVQCHDGDCLYATRKLIHLVHEIYLTFLIDGNYFEYMVEAFDLDPDGM